MKRYFLNDFTVIISAVVLLGACERDNGRFSGSAEPVNIVAESASELFQDGDGAGLYMISSTEPGEKALSAERQLDNVLFTMVDGKFISNPESFFPEDENVYNSIFVYSPYKTDAVAAGDVSMQVSVSDDQTMNFNLNDLMYGVVHDYQPSSSDLVMPFRHALAKVNVQLRPGSGFNTAESMGNPSVMLKGCVLSRTFDFKDVTADYSGDVHDVTPNGFFTASDGTLTGVSAILIPQTLKAGNLLFEIVVDDVKYEYVLEEDMTLASGTENTFTLTVDRGFDGVTVTVGDCEINDWAVEERSEDLDEYQEPGNVVVDIDGNEYPVVKIGRQYWMASNLRVTRLNDGTPIRKNENKLSEWATYEEPAYAAYNFDETLVEQYGYLYNKYNVNTGIICPEGWSVPNDTDWQILCETLGGTEDNYGAWSDVGKALKSSTDWNGTNSSGFNALPGGLLFTGGSAENTVFQSFGSEGNWWTTTGNYTKTLVYGNDLERYMTSAKCGVSIRCIYNMKPIK